MLCLPPFQEPGTHSPRTPSAHPHLQPAQQHDVPQFPHTQADLTEPYLVPVE